ncbi:hypothetical protein FRACA_320038 [Frankia canadensis]|uniref:Uncharacterized protein n=1 Tax=Frankia canadensis TaxID=1836972 RepID=A0A2I2KUL4_9ACTN|nr:hypothetical protein FRACA_320038 [Frankia canadensis]SOU56629.1 hypothetical protein FRACA_320038 [Frankia canadensis]
MRAGNPRCVGIKARFFHPFPSHKKRLFRDGQSMPIAGPLHKPAPTSELGWTHLWTRWPLRLPYLPAAEATVGRLAGQSIVTTIRWATRPRGT